MQIDNDVLKILNKVEESKKEDYEGPGGGEYHLDIDYPEGNLFEEWDSGIISFQKVDNNENMILIFAPEEEFQNSWGLSILDGNENSLIEGTTVQDIGGTIIQDTDDYEVEIVLLNTADWATAWSKIQKILDANPKAKELFGDFKVPAEVVNLMIKWNKLKDAGQKPFVVLKTLGLI